jgi:hypothetical protein
MHCIQCFGPIFKSKPPNKNTDGLDPEGARPDVHRSDGVVCENLNRYNLLWNRLIGNIHYYKHAGVFGVEKQNLFTGSWWLRIKNGFAK